MEQPTLRGVAGTARALLATVEVEEAVGMLIAAFGWDLTVEAVAQVGGDAAAEALVVAVRALPRDGLC